METITADDLRNYLKQQWPSLRGMFQEHIICTDPAFAVPAHDSVVSAVAVGWEDHNHLKWIKHKSDCDQFALLMNAAVSRAQMENADQNEAFYQWAFGECWGQANGRAHAWNAFVSDSGLHVVDYGKIKPIEGYEPFAARF